MITFAYYKYNGDEIFFYNLKGDVVYKEAVHMRTALIKSFDLSIEEYNKTAEKLKKEKFNFVDILVFSDRENKICAFPYFTEEETPIQEIMKKYTTQKDVYRWVLVGFVLMKRKLTIETDWKIVHLETPDFTNCENSYIICESIETFPDFERHSLNRPIIPILDTILHIHKEFYCCTLEQIATIINKCYSEKFADKNYLIDFVFNYFKDELVEICKKEICPIHKIYQCNFYYTFEHSRTIPDIPIHSTISEPLRFMEVCVRPRSCVVTGSSKSYGDIPFTLKPITGNFSIFGPLMIQPLIKCQRKGRGERDDEHYHCLDIYPGLEFEGVYYPPFYMGFKYIEDDKRDFVCRGKIFDDMSVRELLILRDNYNGRILFDNFKTYRNPDSFYLNFRLNDKENIVRKKFMTFLLSKIPTKLPK